jgi:hypothetical protein
VFDLPAIHILRTENVYSDCVRHQAQWYTEYKLEARTDTEWSQSHYSPAAAAVEEEAEL